MKLQRTHLLRRRSTRLISGLVVGGIVLIGAVPALVTNAVSYPTGYDRSFGGQSSMTRNQTHTTQTKSRQTTSSSKTTPTTKQPASSTTTPSSRPSAPPPASQSVQPGAAPAVTSVSASTTVTPQSQPTPTAPVPVDTAPEVTATAKAQSTTATSHVVYQSHKLDVHTAQLLYQAAAVMGLIGVLLYGATQLPARTPAYKLAQPRPIAIRYIP